MAKQPNSLNQGQQAMANLVREVRQRQRSLSALDDIVAPSVDPAEAWARKYASEGFGEVAPDALGPMTTIEKPTASHQAQFMRELKMKTGDHGQHAQSYGAMKLERPFGPMKAQKAQKKSAWSRMLRGK
jgi:hypothetical protein